MMLPAPLHLFSDSFVMEYCGEVCTTEEFVKRKREYHKERRRHYYFMSLKSDEVSHFVGWHSIHRWPMYIYKCTHIQMPIVYVMICGDN